MALRWPEELVVATTDPVDEDHMIITTDSGGNPWPVTVTIVPGGPIAGLSSSVGCGGRAAGRRVVVVVVDSVVVVVDTVGAVVVVGVVVVVVVVVVSLSTSALCAYSSRWTTLSSSSAAKWALVFLLPQVAASTSP